MRKKYAIYTRSTALLVVFCMIFALMPVATFAANVTYSVPGTYGPSTGTSTVSGTVTLGASEITLQNTNITNGLKITAAVGDGSVTLNKVSVGGTTTISGGGERGIVINNSKLGTATVSKPGGKIGIVASGATSITQVNATTGLTLEESGITGTSIGFQRVIVTAPSGSTVNLTGAYVRVRVDTAGVIINLPAGSTIDTLVLNKQANIAGAGTVKSATINASGATFETAPLKMTVASGVTPPTIVGQALPVPPAPAVAGDDALNTVSGMAAGMEYSLDGAAYVAYSPSAFSSISFAGSHTLLVRVAAVSGVNQAGMVTTLTFTANPSSLAKGKLILTFDDAWKDQLTYAYPILSKAGFKATAYVNRDIVTGTDSQMMRPANLTTLYNAGWDISNHTTNHDEIGLKTDAASLAKLKTEYQDNQAWILQNNWTRGAYHAAYPSGSYTTQLIDILKGIGVKTSRATQPGSIPATISGNDLFKLPVMAFSSVYNDAPYVKAAIDDAVANGKTVIVMIHRVEPSKGDLAVTTADLQGVVDHAKQYSDQGKLSVVTVSEWYNSINSSPQTPVTPPAPSVTRNDTLNTVSGMAAGMEYKLDSAAYVSYDPAVFSAISFDGDHTLLVRIAAEGINPAGPATTLTFTTNSTTPVTPPAPPVTNNDTLNTVSGMAAGMEYKLDSAASYVSYDPAVFSRIDFSGNHTLLVRIAAEGINPAGPATTLTFTTNSTTPVTPPAPSVTNNDTLNTVSGMAAGMEYKLDSAAYVSYDPAVFSRIDFSGNHTLLVRIAAEGINPAGPARTLIFTTNPSAAAQAKIVFTFDDGWKDQLTYALPIFSKAGFKGTAYVNRDMATGSDSQMMNISELSQIYAAGWDIGNHTTNHEEIGLNTDPASLARLKSLYLDNQNWILSNGWTRGAYDVCYPSGNFTNQLIEILKGIGVKTARATTEGTVSTVSGDGFYRLPVLCLESTNDANDLIGSIDQAVTTGNDIIVMIHRVEPSKGNLVVTTADLQRVIDRTKLYSDQGKLSVMTMSEWYAAVK